jgi:uncharacterized spore protein YtfJ
VEIHKPITNKPEKTPTKFLCEGAIFTGIITARIAAIIAAAKKIHLSKLPTKGKLQDKLGSIIPHVISSTRYFFGQKNSIIFKLVNKKIKPIETPEKNEVAVKNQRNLVEIIFKRL